MDISSLTHDEVVNSILETMQSFPVLGGRVTPRQAEFIAANLSQAAAERRPSIIVELGGMYKSADGAVVNIIEVEDDGGDKRFLGDNQISYSVDGRWSFVSGKRSMGDLIEVVLQPGDDTPKYEVSEKDLTTLIGRLQNTANESEMGRNLAGTPQTCREAVELLTRHAHNLTRSACDNRDIVKDLGRIAGDGQVSLAVRLHRVVFGSDLYVANRAVAEARDAYLQRKNTLDAAAKRT